MATITINIDAQSNLNWVNVKKYGALGDGTTDDSNSIQAAIDFVDSQGGGTVYFPIGVFVCKVNLKSNIRILGNGYESVLIYPSGSGEGAPLQADTVNNCIIENIRIDGNKSNIGAGALLNFECIGLKSDVNTIINNVWVENCAGDGVDLDGSTNFVIGNIYGKNTGGSVVHPSWDGVKMASDGIIENVFAENCGIERSRFAVDIFTFSTNFCENITINNIHGVGNYGELNCGNCINLKVGNIKSINSTISGAGANKLTNVVIDSIHAEGVVVAPFTLEGNNIHIKNIYTKNSALLVRGGTTIFKNIKIDNVLIERTTTTAIAPVNLPFIDNLIINNFRIIGATWENTTNGCINISDATNVIINNATITYTSSVGSGERYGIRLARVIGGFVNAKVSLARTQGLRIEDSDNIRVTGTYSNNGNATGFGVDGRRSGVGLIGTSKYNNISVTCFDDQSTKTQSYGVFEASTCGANIFTNCVTFGNITDNISTSNVDTIVANNLDL
jgi:hypothetical protein